MIVNGEERPLPTPPTIAALLKELELEGAGIALARNGRVVPRAKHADTVLEATDEIEIIRAVGGG